jgi:hypothetical protein
MLLKQKWIDDVLFSIKDDIIIFLRDEKYLGISESRGVVLRKRINPIVCNIL